MKQIISKFKFLIKDINISKIGHHAAECAYYTILAFIPLILLILTLTKYLRIDENFFIYILEGMIPTEILNDAVISIVKEVQTKSVGTITISAIFTLWSAGKGFFALCRGLNTVYETQVPNNKYIRFRLRAIISTIIFIFLVILTLLILVFGNQINIILQERFKIVSKIVDFLLNSKILISILFLTIIFSLMYRFIPKHKCKLKKQILGAFLAAIACNIMSIFFSIYVDIFNGFSLMYGSLTTIVLAMMWVYACMYIILLGGCMNKFISKKVEKRKKKYLQKSN